MGEDEKVECVVCGAIVNKNDTYVSNSTLDDYTCIECYQDYIDKWIDCYFREEED